MSRQTEDQMAELIPSDGDIEEYHQLVSATRELVCRNILAGDPRSLMYLLGQLSLLLNVIHRDGEANLLGRLVENLQRDFERDGRI